MIYTKLTKKAIKIAFNAHQHQTDKAGMPYIFHPFYLASQMDDEYSICVALLHDVVEDSNYEIEDLINAGFPKEVITAINLLTHQKGVSYMDYINNIKSNELARKVKLADLRHNSDLNRLDFVTEKDLERVKKYIAAINILK